MGLIVAQSLSGTFSRAPPLTRSDWRAGAAVPGGALRQGVI